MSQDQNYHRCERCEMLIWSQGSWPVYCMSHRDKPITWDEVLDVAGEMAGLSTMSALLLAMSK